jgi:ABC-type multidrug transport system fused ATPase/permease subunit
MGMLWPTLDFVLGLAMAITLLVGGHEVLSHRISIGHFVAFNTYMVMLTWPVIALGWVVNLWQRGTASVVRIDELLSDKPTIDDAIAESSIPAETRGDDRVSRSALFLFRSPTLAARRCCTRSRSKFRRAAVWPSSARPARANRRWSI